MYTMNSHPDVLLGGVRPGIALDAELTQVMVQVFVHENRPLLRLERAEEGVWVGGAAGRADGDKAIDCLEEPGAFALEVRLGGVGQEEFRRGGRVAANGLVVAEDHRLDQAAEDVGREGRAFGTERAGGHVKTGGAVGERQGDGQVAPEPVAFGMEAQDALLYVVYHGGVKEIFHGGGPIPSVSLCRPVYLSTYRRFLSTFLCWSGRNGRSWFDESIERQFCCNPR